MPYFNLEQLTKCSTQSEDIIGKNSNIIQSKKLGITTKAKVSRTLDGHISINSFFKNENGINRISQIKIWKFIRSNHPDWFTCVNPGNSVDKFWVLKNEFTLQAKVILGEYIERYKNTLWRHY